MKIGQKVALYYHNVFYRFLTIDRITDFKSESGDIIFGYQTNEGSAFDMNPDPETGRRFNVSGKNFWISEPQVRRVTVRVQEIVEKSFVIDVPDQSEEDLKAYIQDQIDEGNLTYGEVEETVTILKSFKAVKPLVG